MTHDEYLKIANEKVLPAMKGSSCSIVIGAKEPDAKLCMEVGAAVLYDKPIILVIREGQEVSENLKRLAKEIVVCDLEGDSVMEELNRAVKRVIATVQ
jgi:hypothetical protein